jgi:hypothetical protein
MNIKLCTNCIYDLKEYNPYIVDVTIKEVKTIKECDNYCDENGILNVEKEVKQ